MPYVNIHIDLDDFYNVMDRGDKRDIAEWLHEDGILGSHTNPEIRRLVRSDNESPGESEFRDNLLKLWNAHYQLSNEEEDIIKKIASKF